MESPSSPFPEPAEASSAADGSLTHASTNPAMLSDSGEFRRLMRFDNVRTLALNEHAVRFTPLEYRLVRLLLERAGGLVTYDDLTQAGFGSHDSPTSRAALEKHLDRIRSKVRTIGLDLPGVTNYGCLLIWSAVRHSSR